MSARREKVIKTLTGGVSGLFKKNGIELIEGEGSLAGNGAVSVGGHQLSAKTILLATGSVKKPIPGTAFGGRVIGTEEAWALPELPKTMAVVGAGASGAEIASAYARLGVKVLLFEMLDRVLPAEDADISKVAERGLKRQGIEIHTSTPVQNVQSSDSSVTFGYGEQSGEADWLVIAAGRGADTEALGLDGAGVKVAPNGLIDVDGAMRTSAQGVYAIGDLVPGLALAHKASDQGVIAVEDAAGMNTHPIEYADIPARAVPDPPHALRADRRAGARPATTWLWASSRWRGRAPAPSTATAGPLDPSSCSPKVTFRHGQYPRRSRTSTRQRRRPRGVDVSPPSRGTPAVALDIGDQRLERTTPDLWRSGVRPRPHGSPRMSARRSRRFAVMSSPTWSCRGTYSSIRPRSRKPAATYMRSAIWVD